MHSSFMRLLAGSVLVAAVAACDSGGSSSPTPTAAPVATPVAFLIRTPALNPQACMDALIQGTIARNPASGLGLINPGEPPMVVEWPFGYRAIDQGGRVALLDETGKVVAHEGDRITMGGGLGNQLWHGCGPVTLVEAGS